ncbi:hypothetical protein [Sphingosinicella humi]|uniref:DUF2946 domain-containing protein n=1 Tax=Allosphingosinicella humi TaxID=2068657 RepID=A0A2U2J0X7_9SPHN|nr:hypothetical protein [Sphingosinicella humi]PWG01984.1 hypothetical protein DF286_03215 [Sphingosinicella humi]
MSGAAFSIGKIIRTALAVLMMLAAFTPALAEVGCLEDSISHMEVAGDAHDEGGQVIENSFPDDGDRGSQPQPAHCAFNHGAHGSAIPVTAATSVDHSTDKETHLWSDARPLTATAPDGPYHPPQA